MMQGRLADAQQAAARVAEHLGPHAAMMPMIESMIVTPVNVLMRFGRHAEILALTEPPADRPVQRAWHRFARGIALARTGKVDEAAAERKVAHRSDRRRARLRVVWRQRTRVSAQRARCCFVRARRTDRAEREMRAIGRSSCGSRPSPLPIRFPTTSRQSGFIRSGSRWVQRCSPPIARRCGTGVQRRSGKESAQSALTVRTPRGARKARQGGRRGVGEARVRSSVEERGYEAHAGGFLVHDAPHRPCDRVSGFRHHVRPGAQQTPSACPRRAQARLRHTRGDAQPARTRKPRRRVHQSPRGLPDRDEGQFVVDLDRRLSGTTRDSRQLGLLPPRRTGPLSRHGPAIGAGANSDRPGWRAADGDDAGRGTPGAWAKSAGRRSRYHRLSVSVESQDLRRRGASYRFRAARSASYAGPGRARTASTGEPSERCAGSTGRRVFPEGGSPGRESVGHRHVAQRSRHDGARAWVWDIRRRSKR